MSHLPLLVVLIPLFFAFSSSLASFGPGKARKAAVITGVIAHPVAVLLLLVRVASRGPVVYELGGWPAPWGIILVADEAAVIFLTIVGLGMAFAFLYTASTGADRLAKVHVLFFLLTAAASGQVVAGDIFNLFVFIELTTVASIALVALKRSKRSVTAAFTYMVFASISGTFFLLAIALLYNATGTLTMAHIAMRVSLLPPRTFVVVLSLVLISFGIKIAVIPLHFWQADAYSAAGSSSAGVLSGVVMKAGFCGMLRVLFIVLQGGGEYSGTLFKLILAAGCLNVLAGHLAALFQQNLKKMLAFSSIAHVGYMLIGVGAASAAGLAAGIFHGFNHFFLKAALFWSGRFFIEKARSPFIFRMEGFFRSAPVVSALFFLSALAIIGVPPTSGFASKWLIALAVQQAGFLFPIIVISAGTVISLWYYARVVVIANKPAEGRAVRSEQGGAGGRIGAFSVLCVLTIYSLTAFFFFPLFYPLFEAAAQRLMDPSSYIALVFPGGSP